jgi:L-histidine N-alpha-methyltransferase
MDDPEPAHARAARGRVTISRLGGGNPAASIGEDVRRGLSNQPKFLSPKYFYDEQGSALFERICDAPEYYLTRTENALLAKVSESLIEQVRPGRVIELGSGSSTKTEHLLSACARQHCYARYVPFDVSAETLTRAGERLARKYAWLEVEGLVGDYWQDLKHVPLADEPRLFLFLGSTIGNFDDHEAIVFLRELRSVMNGQDWLLLGVDRVKDESVLNAAYNDVAGLTAEFNLNVLAVINRHLGADFAPGNFEHHAWYHAARSRIEMHLRSRRSHTVHLRALDLEVAFAPEESILTEISRKFTPDSFGAMLMEGGFAAQHHFEPANGYFSLILARPTH